MGIVVGQPIVASDFIDESEKDPTPANDEGRVPKLESTGKLSKEFLPPTADIQIFTASGTWTKPSTGTMALIKVWGGGGSGGAASWANRSAASGGAGGEYRVSLIPLYKLAATETVTVGLGGPAASSMSLNNTANGNVGGASSFGSHVTANGGNGGLGAGNSSGTVTANAAAGGVGGSNANIAFENVNGVSSSSASTSGTTPQASSGGDGGGVPGAEGGDGGAGVTAAGTLATGVAGSTPGGGGGGAAAGFVGAQAISGAGANGRVEIIVF
ncbi:hypothetical protein E3V39_12455 [Gammaproteobacteria bacterium LSUCC0112]|nr:hypothetical protein E3V39_12455 [Gammaproteobacteria bacterium LSUCC0112]